MTVVKRREKREKRERNEILLDRKQISDPGMR
jgi:hypothetical protein